jgi:phytoene dehydrogenase-like protein
MIQDSAPEQAEKFDAFCNEQLMITAQNHAGEVNALFGAAALCYTNYPNYYVMGGMINLIRPLVNYLESRGSKVNLREGVKQVKRSANTYFIESGKGIYESEYFVSGIPLNNTLDIFGGGPERRKMESSQLTSAFSMGIVMKRKKEFETLHHQIHLPHPLPETGSGSIFVSLGHPDDRERCGPDEVVASVSTHLPDPGNNPLKNKALVEETIFMELEKHGFLKKEDVIYSHSSTQKSWEKWTGRKYGFVGGYPQYRHIKPWQMQDARLDQKKAYICGDSTYPGQGIPGACLSGILAFEKLSLDNF